MPDDFLFDPWGSGGGDDAPPVVEPIPAEQETAAGSVEGRPSSGGSRWRARSVTRPLSVPVPVAGPRPVERPLPIAPGARSGSTPLARSTHSMIDRIRGIMRPHLEAVAARLQIARHHTLLDDRLDGPAGAIRFRLVPRPAPFDEPAAVPGSVLELVAAKATVGARLWLDPVAEEPAEDLEIPASEFSEEWLDAVVVDFVARTLRQG